MRGYKLLIVSFCTSTHRTHQFHQVFWVEFIKIYLNAIMRSSMSDKVMQINNTSRREGITCKDLPQELLLAVSWRGLCDSMCLICKNLSKLGQARSVLLYSAMYVDVRRYLRCTIRMHCMESGLLTFASIDPDRMGWSSFNQPRQDGLEKEGWEGYVS